MTQQAASLPSTANRPKTKTCGSCRGPLEANQPICPRCDADNTEWLKFQTGHFNGYRLREVIALVVTGVAFVMLIVVGYGLFVLLGARVWGEPVGVVLLVASLPLAGVGFWYSWSEREVFRQSLHMPGMGFKAQMLMILRRTLVIFALSIVAALGGPLLMFVAPLTLQIGSTLFDLPANAALPEITRGTYVLMFLVVWFFYIMQVCGEALGHVVAREYAWAANATAPPLLFERQEKFYELCKQAVLTELAAIVDPKKVKWLRLERADNGGMTVQVSVPSGAEAVEKINEFAYDRVPTEKKYDVKLDRWARLTSIALAKD